MSKERAAGRKARGKADRRDQAKVTLWLPAELARKIRTAATWEGKELGDVAAPPLEAAFSSFYCTARGAKQSISRPAGPTEPPAVRLAAPPVAGEAPGADAA
jgi:hypothetical protein